MSEALFPPLSPPRIYAYADTNFPDCLKVGFTSRTVAERIGIRPVAHEQRMPVLKSEAHLLFLPGQRIARHDPALERPLEVGGRRLSRSG